MMTKEKKDKITQDHNLRYSRERVYIREMLYIRRTGIAKGYLKRITVCYISYMNWEVTNIYYISSSPNAI